MTRMQSKVYNTEPSSFSSLFNLPESRPVILFGRLGDKGSRDGAPGWG